MTGTNLRLREFGNIFGGTSLLPQCEAAFKRWHECVRSMMMLSADSTSADEDATQTLFEGFVSAHVHDDVELCPPTYFATYTGKGPFAVILQTVATVFGPSFTYHRQWLSDDGREWALEFNADGLGGTKNSVRGIDLVSLDERGRILNFRILAGAFTCYYRPTRDYRARLARWLVAHWRAVTLAGFTSPKSNYVVDAVAVVCVCVRMCGVCACARVCACSLSITDEVRLCVLFCLGASAVVRSHPSRHSRAHSSPQRGGSAKGGNGQAPPSRHGAHEQQAREALGAISSLPHPGTARPSCTYADGCHRCSRREKKQWAFRGQTRLVRSEL